MRNAAQLTLLLGLGACASMAPKPPRPIEVFAIASPADYAPYLAKGSGTVAGQAFLTTRGGDVKVAAGREVTLDPQTAYADEWYGKYGRDMSRWSEMPTDSLFRAARRTTIADAQGKFVFAGVPAGKYLVRSSVTWEVPTSNMFMSDVQGGVVAKHIMISEGETVSPILNSMAP
jgi:hypothetical protein